MFSQVIVEVMLRNISYISISMLLATASCIRLSIKPEMLRGKWNYVKVENPNSNPPDSVSSGEIKAQAPYILFTKQDSLQIWWGGKLLSHGSYRIDHTNILFKEILPGGKTREFPFIVSTMMAKKIVFETTGVDGTMVTAVKQ